MIDQQEPSFGRRVIADQVEHGRRDASKRRRIAERVPPSRQCPIGGEDHQDRGYDLDGGEARARTSPRSGSAATASRGPITAATDVQT